MVADCDGLCFSCEMELVYLGLFSRSLYLQNSLNIQVFGELTAFFEILPDCFSEYVVVLIITRQRFSFKGLFP